MSRPHSLLVRRLVRQRGRAATHQPPGAVLAPPEQAVNPYDYSADAGYQRVRAIGERDVGNAQADALAQQKQLAIDQGDPSLAPDEQTAAAARANPFSVMAQLAKHRAEDPRALTEADNSQNLFYSGAAAKHQSDLVRSLLQQETDANSSARARMSDIQGGLLQARQSAADQTSQAQEEAAGRLRDRLGDLPVGPQGNAAPGAPARAQSLIHQAVRDHIRRPRRPRQPGGHIAGAVGGYAP